MIPAYAPHCPRCEELEAEVEWLKNELAGDPTEERLGRLHRIGMSAGIAHLALAMLGKHGRVLSKVEMLEAIPQRDHAHDRDGSKLVDIYICRLRKCLGAHAVETVWGHGRVLTEVGVAKLRAALGEFAP